MGIEDGIGKINTRPSKLDELLDAFKHPASGVIEISPVAAKTLLYERLLAHFRATQEPNDKVEVLAQIAEGYGHEPVNFNNLLKNLQEKRQAEEDKMREIIEKGRINIIEPRIRQPEI